MTKTDRAPQIPDYIRKIIIYATILVTVSAGVLVTAQQLALYDRLSNQMREEAIQEQKAFLKDLIALEFEYIRNQKRQFDQQVVGELAESVNGAYALASSLYVRYNGKMSDEELKRLIVMAVGSLHSDSPYSRVFINDLEGRGVFYKGRPDFKGRNLIDLMDVNGNRVVEKEIELVRSQNEGFIRYEAGQRNGLDSIPVNKACFVKVFEPFNWYFGAKCYIEDYYEEFKSQIATKISSERFRYGGYVFVNELGGNPVVFDGSVYQGTYNFHDGTNEARGAVFAQQVAAVRSGPEGGYFEYQWNKIGVAEVEQKISFVRLFEPCNWIVGAGFYVSDIESDVVAQNRELQEGIYRNIIQVLLVLVVVVGFELYLIGRFNQNFQADFNHFDHFFRLGKGRYQPIKVNELHFREFRNMAEVANDMIEERARVHQQLVEEQQRAQESDRLKTAFLANMSHEIRTPMNAILGFSELLNDQEVLPEQRKMFIELIRQNGEMLLALISDIIDIAKIESGSMTVVRKPFRLVDMLVELQQYYDNVLHADNTRSVRYELDCQIPDDFQCMSDEFRLKQVLINLIGNAVKFTREGVVRLEVMSESNRVYFKVIDTGIGIPEADLETVFERFMQAGGHESHNFGGTGLGLAISKNIVALLGGDIWVMSKEGEGAEFQFFISC
ncbi:cache domain-containing protein [Mangrovibacterium sp.]|uniref:cache domain-containing protein n=1 Tax=Mangrovibacterium sp. TaxID=1961364 RepID=UPI00356ACCE3